MIIGRLILLFIFVVAFSTESNARLICGWTQMKHFGVKDQKYRLARNWLNFPRTSAHPGAVVVQYRNGRSSDGRRGMHVSRIERLTGTCSAIVADEKGYYERNICARGATIVDPSGNRAAHL